MNFSSLFLGKLTFRQATPPTPYCVCQSSSGESKCFLELLGAGCEVFDSVLITELFVDQPLTCSFFPFSIIGVVQMVNKKSGVFTASGIS